LKVQLRECSSHTDVDVTKSSQALAELSNLLFVGLDFFALGVLGGTLLLGVEAQVLQEDDLATGSLVDGLLNLGTNAVLGEGNVLPEELGELSHDGLQAILGVDLAIGAAKVGHQDHGLSAVVDGILDSGQGTDNALVVGDVLVRIEGDVEVNLSRGNDEPLRFMVKKSDLSTYPNQDTLVLEVDIGDVELVGERHCRQVSMSVMSAGRSQAHRDSSSSCTSTIEGD
jgi:hypothetical protein